jgi:predicted DNA-binding transcriptional regulator AlpA
MSRPKKEKEPVAEEALAEELEPLDEAQRFVTVVYVARRFDVNASTIWKWVREGFFPKPMHFGRRATSSLCHLKPYKIIG